MKQDEKMEYARAFLQKRIDREFPYPFQVSYEGGQFLFRLRSGKRECCAKLKQSREMLECICEGPGEKRDEQVTRLFEILRAAIRAQESTALSEESSYERVKNDLILRPLNYHSVKGELGDVPHIRLGDVALVLYAVMAHEGDDYFTAKMHAGQMKHWDIPKEQVLREALINTSFLYPPRLYRMEDLLAWEQKRYEDGQFMLPEGGVAIRKGVCNYVLTNTLEINGAVALFYPGVARKIADGFGEDFYIAFTSIHEAQIHAVSRISPDVVESSLRDTNRRCNRREEMLTDRVYCYRADRGCYEMLCDGVFSEVGKNV